MNISVMARVRAGALAAATLAAAGAASAQVTGIVTSRTVSGYSYDPVTRGPTGELINEFRFSREVSNGAFQYNLDPVNSSKVNIQTSANAGDQHIEFANNVTAQGLFSFGQSTTTVTVNYKNSSTASINAKLVSTIIPAGLGFYQADPSLNAGDHAGDINHNPETRSNVSMGSAENYYKYFIGVDTDLYDSNILATAGISFEISDGVKTLAKYVADMILVRDDPYLPGGVDPDYFRLGKPVQTLLTGYSEIDGVRTPFDLYTTLADGSSPQAVLDLAHVFALKDFQRVGTDSLLKQVSYRWEETDLTVRLGRLAPGEERSLIYRTTAYAGTSALSAGGGEALLAYAGFGDPIGANRGGGAIEDPAFPLIDLGGLDFDPVTGDLEGMQFEGYQPDQLPLQQIFTAGGVPEPATWALMLGGFGLAGVALRRRLRLA